METKAIGRVISRMAAPLFDGGSRLPPFGVSIAIPNWNHECVLPRSIGSALRAVRALSAHNVPAETLVVDDRSRDGSPVLLRQLEALYYDVGLRVLVQSQNKGLPVTRNYALTHATYRYIVFMDADNEIIPENLHAFLRSIIQTRAAAVYGNLVWQGRGDQRAMMSNESFQDRIVDDNYIDAFALFDRVQLLDAGAYVNDLATEAREDWELYLHLATNGRRVVFVPMLFGIYYSLDGSMIQEASIGYNDQQNYVRRVYNQLGLRKRLPLNTRHLRYHPDIGYL